jgi:hypothetical protein
MRTRASLGIVILLSLLVLAPLAAQSSTSDMELWSYIQRQSAIWWQSYVEEHGEIDPGAWQTPIENAFLRLANNSGQKGFSISYAVLKDPDFNASCFPGGQFIIHQGTLRILDEILTSQFGDLSKIPAQKLDVYRELMLAPIIAHELGHYYNRHSFASMKAQFSMAELGQPDIDLQLIRFSQANELDADRTGYILLQKSGHNPDLMLTILELLNEIQQQDLSKHPDAQANVYLTSHPSPHARLAAFKSDDQALHALAAGLEQAFSSVQLGKDLDKAIAVLDQALTMAPANMFLKKEKAIALHKQWLLTVALKDQKLRGIVDSPAFRDEMVFSSRAGRGTTRVLPGDRALWMKAREAYRTTYEAAMDQVYNSNFALLLGYSTDAGDMKAAVQLAYSAAKELGSFATASNLAVVCYITDQPKPAMEILADLASEYDQKYTALLTSASKNAMVTESIQSLREQMHLTQMLDSTYVYGDFTPLLNLALIMTYEGQKQNAAGVATQYLTKYECTSAWAAYLSATTGVAIPARPSSAAMPVNGLTVGSPLTTAVAKWGKATNIKTYSDGDEEWSYAPLSSVLTISDGAVQYIQLNAADSPKVDNRFGVGSARADIEKIFGKPTRSSDAYIIYDGPQSIAVIYVKDVAQQVLLFR